jgi:predicted SAM-dependent methyltransferase
LPAGSDPYVSGLRKAVAGFAWAGFVVRRRLKQKILLVRRLFWSPPLPVNPDGRVYIHLGCGGIASPEFINVDICPAPHVHYVREVSDLSVFPDDYADLIYACHLLEHMNPRDLPKVLWEWRRVLKPGGVLRLSVPDFDNLVDMYEACGRDVEGIGGPLMGEWGPYKSHAMVFNFQYLRNALVGVGFTDIRRWDPACVENHDFEDWASKPIQLNGSSFHISLNVEGVK